MPRNILSQRSHKAERPVVRDSSKTQAYLALLSSVIEYFASVVRWIHASLYVRLSGLTALPTQ